MNLKAKWFYGAAAFAALAVPAFSQVRVGVYLGAPPPPVRYERRPEMPGAGYVWTEGYWEPNGGRYRWHGGAWQRPPYEGAYYTHPHYDHYRRGWALHEGHWDRENHGAYEEEHERYRRR
jgi:hypothetical protein